MLTIIVYVALAILSLWGLTALITGLFSSILLFVTRNVFISSITSALITWFILAYTWKLILGQNIPVAALALSFIGFYLYGVINKEKLSENAKTMIGGELIGAIIFSTFYCFKITELHWI